MCRLLCYMGEAIPMDLLITKPEHSLVFQSRDASFHPGCLDKRNIRVNGDGFGVAWYNPKRIAEGGCLVKFPTPMWSSANLLNIAKFVESGLVFAHVRAASDGAALVGNVNHENTHPFKNKRYTFMHNGGIPGFDKMKRQLLSLVGDEAYEAIEGTTDSEVCFAFFLDELPSTDAELGAAEIAQVLRRTIARIVCAVARFAVSCSPVSAAAADSKRKACDGSGMTPQDDATTATAAATAAAAAAASETEKRGGETEESTRVRAPISSPVPAPVPPMSLNFCVTDGRHIVCSRYRNHPRQAPPSLFVLSGAGFACDKEGSCLRLTASEPHTSVVISSEPLCRSTKSWQLVPRNSMVIVEGVGDGDNGGGVGGAKGDGTPARQQGLVASIKYEPLRCHPSDMPDPHDPAFPDPCSLPTSCARVCGTSSHGSSSSKNTNRSGSRNSSSGSRGRGEHVGLNGGPSNHALPPQPPLREGSVNVGGGAGNGGCGGGGGGGGDVRNGAVDEGEGGFTELGGDSSSGSCGGGGIARGTELIATRVVAAVANGEESILGLEEGAETVVVAAAVPAAREVFKREVCPADRDME